MGDLNGDFLNNHADFVLFKSAYDSANGAGAFFAMLSAVPVPSAFLLLAFAVLGWPIADRRRQWSRRDD
jgi:hypothetical protein